MTGYSPEETIGFNCRFLQGSDSQQSGLVKLRASVNKNEACTVTIRNYKKSGEMFWNELHVTPYFDEVSGQNFFIGVQHDVTAQVEFRHQREMFNAGLIHDIKGPLYGQAKIFAYLNATLPVSSKLDEAKRLLLESPDASSKLIEDTLSLYKLENDAIAPVFTWFEARMIAEKVLAAVDFTAAEKDVKIQILEPGDVCTLYGDINMAYRALRNLVDNALKNSERNGSISIFMTNTASSTVLAVMDNAGGLPEQLKKKFNELFQTLETVFSGGRGESTGLGLMTCSQIMRLHGGTLSLLKSDDYGTDIALIFPRPTGASNSQDD